MWHVVAYIAAVVAALAWFLEKLYHTLRIDFDTPKEQTMTELDPQSLPRFYFCAVMQALRMSPGKFYPALPGEKLTQADPDSSPRFNPPQSEKMRAIECSMKHDKLRLYRKSIGYSGDPKQIPPIFMSSYFNKAIIALGASQFSRVRILGVVHMQQQVTVYRDLRHLIRENFHLTLLSEKYEETSRGVQVTLRARVFDLNDVLVWEAMVVGLTVAPKRKSTKKLPSPREAVNFSVYKEEEIFAPADIGLDFAHASQDWQPQHLTKWTSKLVGFSSPIAHGLWSMAVAVDRIMARERNCFEDKYPLHIDVHFKKPLVLPGHARLQFEKPAGQHAHTNFRMVHATGSNAPILTGTMHVGEEQNLQPK